MVDGECYIADIFQSWSSDGGTAGKIDLRDRIYQISFALIRPNIYLDLNLRRILSLSINNLVKVELV